MTKTTASGSPSVNYKFDPLTVYKWVFSPVLHAIAGPGFGCRYIPTCSEYAREAIRAEGIFRGTVRATLRILRCHPIRFLGGGAGYDPVRIKGNAEVRTKADD